MKRIRHGQNKGKKSIRDFHKKRYGNPLFPKNRQKSRAGRKGNSGVSVWKRIFVVIFLLALLSALGYGIWSPTFKITAVEIDGATPMTEQRIRELLRDRLKKQALLVFPQSTIFFFSTKDAIKDIEGVFFLEDMTIQKRLPGRVTVSVREIPKKAVLFADNKFNAVSETGAVIRELTEKEVQRMNDLPTDIASVLVDALGAEMVELHTLQPEAEDGIGAAKKNGNEFPLVFDDEHDEDPFMDTYRPGDTAFVASTVALLLQANTRLPDITSAAVRWFNVREKDEAVDVMMEGDWHVYLTTALPFDIQGERLALILKEKVGQDRDRLQYVDLRYNERIFFKLRDIEENEEE